MHLRDFYLLSEEEKENFLFIKSLTTFRIVMMIVTCGLVLLFLICFSIKFWVSTWNSKIASDEFLQEVNKLNIERCKLRNGIIIVDYTGALTDCK